MTKFCTLSKTLREIRAGPGVAGREGLRIFDRQKFRHENAHLIAMEKGGFLRAQRPNFLDF